MVHGKSEDIHQKLDLFFVIPVRTGKVLDYIVKILVCHNCQNFENKHKTKGYIQWSEKPSSVCYVNHKGHRIVWGHKACEIYLWSIEKCNLKYTQLVGDRDTGAFAKVSDSCEKAFNMYIISEVKKLKNGN